MAIAVPSFSYTGTHSTKTDSVYWYLYLKGGGTLKFTYAKKSVDVFIVGGGGGGKTSSGGGPGGAGGSTLTKTGIALAAGTNYTCAIGAGGAANGNGGASSAFGYSAAGGAAGGGAAAGTAGANGTYAFGDSSQLRYGAQGGGGSDNAYGYGSAGGLDGGGTGAAGGRRGTAATAGAANTGSGGGGSGDNDGWDSDENDYEYHGGPAAGGGSGIIIIRGTEADYLPVWYNGTHLQKIFFNGSELSGLKLGDTTVFFRRLLERLKSWTARRVPVVGCSDG